QVAVHLLELVDAARVEHARRLAKAADDARRLGVGAEQCARQLRESARLRHHVRQEARRFAIELGARGAQLTNRVVDEPERRFGVVEQLFSGTHVGPYAAAPMPAKRRSIFSLSTEGVKGFRM